MSRTPEGATTPYRVLRDAGHRCAPSVGGTESAGLEVGDGSGDTVGDGVGDGSPVGDGLNVGPPVGEGELQAHEGAGVGTGGVAVADGDARTPFGDGVPVEDGLGFALTGTPDGAADGDTGAAAWGSPTVPGPEASSASRPPATAK